MADEMRVMVERFGSADLLQGKILANLFYEPSAHQFQLYGGHDAAGRPGNPDQQRAVQLGDQGRKPARHGAHVGELLRRDRHSTPRNGCGGHSGSLREKPVINAGDGVGEHPTQALLDLFTIVEALGKVDGLKVAMVGDLKYGRTVHSLTKLLVNYDVEFTFVSPEMLPMPGDVLDVVRSNARKADGHAFSMLEDVHEVIADVDVLYVTRVQKERFTDMAEYDRVKDQYVVDDALMQRAKERMIVMHPLPRVNEISYTVDNDPRAAYFRQMRNGMYVRMALLASVLGKA
ncbi:MAG: aspartate carbamoyltransferase [Caldilineaceae bacterium]